ncbi:MAG: DUF4349 domain-containing protein [Defluviitaleaceae bacterium]|nr:DUF4349 domain-containing protein [Defluviitaleaceae bacterium]MCL2276220.1 DUF4349 domain-containing protein [Defluviitaleaceae bacterium]
MRKKLLCIVPLALLLLLTACGGGNMDAMPTTDTGNVQLRPAAGAPAPTPAPGAAPPPPPVESVAAADAPQEFAFGAAAEDTRTSVEWEDLAHAGARHIIQRADVTLESEYFDDAVATLRHIAPALQGYIESELLTRTGLPRLTIVMRIPAPRFEAALQQVEAVGEVISQRQSAEDVTDRFYDMAGNLATRRIEEERILDLIYRTTNLNELLALESRLTAVRLVIHGYESQLNQLAGQIAYSTIAVTLTQTPEPTEEEDEEEYYVAVIPPPTLGERIGGAFGESVDGTVGALQNVVVFLAGAIIPLVLIAVFGILLWQVGKRIKRPTLHP